MTTENSGYRVSYPLRKNLGAEAICWCYDNFGQSDGVFGFSEKYPWYANMREFVFWNEKDAVLFALRWL